MSLKRRQHIEVAIIILAGAIFLLLVCGCGAKREETQHREEQAKTATVEKTHTQRSTIAPDGTPYVEETLTVRTLDSTTQSQADTEIRGSTTIVPPPILDVALKAAAGAGGATPWGAIAGLVVTAATGAYAAHQSAKAKGERVRADEHKADADEGWKKADAYAKALPPKTAPYDGGHA